MYPGNVSIQIYYFLHIVKKEHKKMCASCETNFQKVTKNYISKNITLLVYSFKTIFKKMMRLIVSFTTTAM